MERILLVDDDRFILSGVGRVLEKEGYEVVEAESGEAAVEYMAGKAFDLVLTDLVMGRISGVEVLQESKRLLPGAMVIILTGYADMKAAMNAIEFGADDFMIKPAEPEEICFRVRKCLENKVLREKIEERTLELERLNRELELDITERKKVEKALSMTNSELNDSLEQLKFAQDKLIQKEKLAALGGLVAGVTHELNTPVGIGITASSFIAQQIDKVSRELENRGCLSEYVNRLTGNVRESARMISSSLERAGELISNFKRVSVDQESGKGRSVIVREYLNEVLSSLSFEFKTSRHKIEVDCPEDVVFNSRPGALAQIITNFIMNAMLHAFEGVEEGLIRIDVTVREDMMVLTFSDNGRGMPEYVKRQIFDPFFTTKREAGGSGLGMYLVYNLVTNALNGTIECESEPGNGTRFSVSAPLNNRDHAVL